MGYGLSQTFVRFQLKVSEFYNLFFSNTNTVSPNATSSRNQKLKLDPTKSKLPDDVIFQDILPKLPAKSLVRFKSVSPSWNSFISSVEFAETISSLSSRCVLTLEDDLSHFVALDYNDETNLVAKVFGKQFSRNDTLCSSCNGLVFLISCDESNDYGLHFPRELHQLDFNYVVYNPVLGVDHFVEIPHPNEFPLSLDHFQFNRNYSFGFGYVSSLDDYFIVAIDFPLRFNMVVYVYSLRTRQWRISPGTIEVDDETLPLQFEDPWFYHTGTLVKETLYWGMSQGGHIRFIFAYYLETQNYYELIDLPYGDFGDLGLSRFSLCCLDDSLCAWANYYPYRFEMWMLEEDEELESGYSWTWLFNFSPDYFVRNFFGSNRSGMILVFSTGNELILGDFTCDPPELTNAVLENKCDAVDYVASLVSVPNIAAVQRA